jgi:hypothetical protein
MDQRLQFVARRLANGGSLQGVWDLAPDRLQIFNRYQECGMVGLGGLEPPTSPLSVLQSSLV